MAVLRKTDAIIDPGPERDKPDSTARDV